MATLQGKAAITTLQDGDLVSVHDISSTTEDAAGDLKKITVANMDTHLAATTKTLTNKTFDTSSNTFTVGATFAMAGFDITGAGTVSMIEQAAANADVAGSGQFWVQTATPNLPMFTNDAGTDGEILTTVSGTTLVDTAAVVADSLPFFDASDSDNAKQDTIGDILTLAITRTETLTNKTLTAPVITDPLIEHRNYEDTTAGASAHTLVAADQSSVIEMNNASAQTLTIPPNSSVAFPVGTLITVVMMGAGTTTILGGTGVTLQGNGGSASAGSTTIQTQYGMASLYKRATDIWVVSGDIAAVS